MVKQQVLAALDAARGRYISGQELAAQLGVSRTAVWKAVAALRSDGIPIEAVTNRGYALAADADVLNAAAVAALLGEYGVRHVDVLPCHSFGSGKYRALSRPVPDVREFSPAGLHVALERFAARGLETEIV